jgi:glycosyltransferase involved in cell wall biosynthesis
MSSGSNSPFRDRSAHPLAGVTVLQIVPDLEPGGLAEAAIGTAGALSRAGANALIASRGGRLVSELQARGGLFTPFPAHAQNPVSMILNVRRLARLIKSERVDIVHARSRASAWVAYGATRLTRTPFVTSFRGSYAREGPLALRYNSVMARGDAVIAGSAFTADVIGGLFPGAKGRIHVVVGGVDCRLYAPKAVTPARVQAVRRIWGAAQDERIIYAVAGARTSSGAKTVVEAVRLLAGQADAGALLGGTKFIIACDEGGGAFARDIDAAIGKAGLQNIVRTCEASADRPAALLASAVVLALSAHLESFAGFALEAQAMGAPVIVADPGAASETILAPPDVDVSARTGWRTPLNAEVVAAALREALSLGATARDRLSLLGRAHVEARFSIAQTSAQTLGAYAAARGGAR